MQTPERILREYRRIAVVGLSTNPAKVAHSVPAAMQAAGFEVIGIHPTATELLGVPAYQRLEDVPGPIDIVNVFRPSDEAAEIALQASGVGAKALWLQQGIVSDHAKRLAEYTQLEFVQDTCIAVVRAVHGIRKN